MSILNDGFGEEFRQSEATEEWLGVLSRLWMVPGKSVDPDRMEAYQKILGDVPIGLLELAINRVFREHVYSNVPMPGSVSQAVAKELESAGVYTIEQWCSLSSDRLLRFSRRA